MEPNSFLERAALGTTAGALLVEVLGLQLGAGEGTAPEARLAAALARPEHAAIAGEVRARIASLVAGAPDEAIAIALRHKGESDPAAEAVAQAAALLEERARRALHFVRAIDGRLRLSPPVVEPPGERAPAPARSAQSIVELADERAPERLRAELDRLDPPSLLALFRRARRVHSDLAELRLLLHDRPTGERRERLLPRFPSLAGLREGIERDEGATRARLKKLVVAVADRIVALPAPERLRLARERWFLPDLEPLEEAPLPAGSLPGRPGAVAVRALRGSRFAEQESIDQEDRVIDALLDIRAPSPSSIARPSMPAPGGERIFAGAPPDFIFTHWRSLETLVAWMAPRPGERWIDLGAGNGRLGFELAFRVPGVAFHGFEIVAERIDPARRSARALALPETIAFVEQNLADPSFALPEGDVYFLYDPFSTETYATIVGRLREIASARPIRVVALGNANVHFRDAAWLAPRAIVGHASFPPTVYASILTSE